MPGERREADTSQAIDHFGAKLLNEQLAGVREEVRVLSPGTFPLFVTITSPDGSLQVLRTQVTIRSTAFSGVGVALSAVSGVFLLLWWGRHWRTVRRARHLVPVS